MNSKYNFKLNMKIVMKKRLILATFLILSGLFVQAQNVLKFRINGAKDTTIFLANYYGNKLYYSDTAKCNADGQLIFSTKKKFDPGVYAVVLSGKFFEIILNNEDVDIETDRSDLAGKVVVKESSENKIFYNYVAFINARRKEAEPLREQLKSLKKEDKEYKKVTDKLADIDKQVKNKQLEIIKNNPKLLVGKIINMSIDPEIPEPPKGPDGKPLDSLFAYKWMRNHYFDNIDFSDERLVRSPFFHNRIENYFKNLILQQPDTCFKEAKKLIEKIQATYPGVNDTVRKHEMFKYVVHLLTYTFEQSKIMCMDAAFVQMVFHYHKQDKVWWIKKKDLKKYTDRAEELAPIACNNPAHPLSLPDSTETNWRRLYDLKSDFTILVFWDPECGHCKKEMPAIAELHAKLKKEGKSVEVYAVSSDHNKKWKQFIEENKMGDFTNVALPQKYFDKQELAREVILQGKTDLKSMNYRTTFDVYSTPKVFLLDSNKKILAKQLEAEQLETLIDKYIEFKNKEKE